jgi:Uri superfamily endonuclease
MDVVKEQSAWPATGPDSSHPSEAGDRLAAVARRISGQHGTYALVLACRRPVETAVGMLGPVRLTNGYWVYVGSAFGPGGLRARLAHHLKPSVRPHWHLDYIKGALQPIEIWTTTDPVKREHDWVRLISGLKGASRPIAGFGASDCACRTHLIHLRRRPQFRVFTRLVMPRANAIRQNTDVQNSMRCWHLDSCGANGIVPSTTGDRQWTTFPIY